MKRMTRLVTLTAAAAIIATQTNAAIIASIDINATNLPNGANSAPVGTSTHGSKDANLLHFNFINGPGLGVVNTAAGQYRLHVNSDGVGDLYDTNISRDGLNASGAYLEFTLEAAPGFLLSLDETSSFAFQIRSWSSGNTDPDFQSGLYIRSSLDAYATTLDTVPTVAAGATATFFDVGTGFEDLSLVTFRVYYWEAVSSPTPNQPPNIGYLHGNGTLDGTNDFIVNGSVYAVPEPSTYAALLGLFGLGFVIYRRRKQK